MREMDQGASAYPVGSPGLAVAFAGSRPTSLAKLSNVPGHGKPLNPLVGSWPGMTCATVPAPPVFGAGTVGVGLLALDADALESGTA
jgi:hypothetical protein